MSDMAKKAREAMKAKAQRLGASRPLEKVDSSDFTPPELLNADIKTGARPISRRAFKKGGRVSGEDCGARADRKPRKSGGKAEVKEWVNAKVNRNVKDANEEREGIKHVGGFKKGGRTKYATTGSVPLPPPRPKNLDEDRELSKQADMLNDTVDADYRKQLSDRQQQMAPRKKGGRVGKLSGGKLGRYAAKAANEVAWRGADYGEKAEIARRDGKYGNLKAKEKAEAKLGKRARGLEMAISKMSGAPFVGHEEKPILGYKNKARIGSTERQADIDSGNMKKGGRVKKEDGGGTMLAAQRMMQRAQGVAGVPAGGIYGAGFDRAGAGKLSPMAAAVPMARMKKGGKAESHSDEAMDRALIKKMVKPSARTGKNDGGEMGAGAGKRTDKPENVARPKYNEEAVDKAIASSRQKIGGREGSAIKALLKGRTGRKQGGGVFSGPSYPGKVPGVTGGRIARATGGKTKGKGKTDVNIVIAAGKPAGGPEMAPPAGPMRPPGAMPVPVPPPGMAGAAPAGIPVPMPAGAPPAAGLGAGAPGMGNLPLPRKAGGRVSKIAKSYKDMTAGAASGEGRLQKSDIAKRSMRKAGGKVYRSYKDMDAGAASGLGRLEKTEIASRKQ